MATFSMFVFWICAAFILYSWLVYPAVLWCLSRLFGAARRACPTFAEAPPLVSLLIVAHNEVDVIAARVANALALDYPHDRIEIVIASDGSSDATVATALTAASGRARVIDYRQRRGKAAVLNAAFRELGGSIVVLSDANTQMASDAVRRLVRWFDDPSVGVVCGRLTLRDAATGTNVDGLYWRYETFLKRAESRLGALLGANGALYAVRRDLFTGIGHHTIVDDFVLPLVTRLRTGCAIVYDGEAHAEEDTPHDMRAEFQRRTRLGAGGFQSLHLLWRLLHPRHGWVAFTFASHKLTRWFCPFALLGCLAANTLLLSEPFYRVLFGAQVALYAAAGAGTFVRGRGGLASIVRLSTMFTGMNAALLVGFWRWARGTQGGAWQRTAR